MSDCLEMFLSDFPEYLSGTVNNRLSDIREYQAITAVHSVGFGRLYFFQGIPPFLLQNHHFTCVSRALANSVA